jgi:hypothetical protein
MDNEAFKKQIVDELKLLAGKTIAEGNQYVLNINNGVPEVIAQAIVNMMYDNGLFVEKLKR